MKCQAKKNNREANGMTVSYSLSSDRGYKWINCNGVKLKGYFLGQSPEKVASQIASLDNEEQITEFISSLSGCFSIIIDRGDLTLAYVDRVRSIPLFYQNRVAEIIIYDSLSSETVKGKPLDPAKLREFDYSLFISGNSTAVDGIYQIPAGYCLRISGESAELKRYWIFSYSETPVDNEKEAVKYIGEEYGRVFSDIAEYVGDRTVVIPLSGGHDSRLILASLIRSGCKNIITYSYGSSKWKDSPISVQVADYYSVPHYFVPYTKKQKRRFDSLFKESVDYSSNFSSVPVIQELIAIDTLVKQKKIPRDAIFIPGYGGVITGHYIHENYLTGSFTGKSVSDFIVSTFFGKRIGENPDLESSIITLLNNEYEYKDSDLLSGTQANEIFEKYVFQEEQAKFIANAVRTYEFFGFEWIMPLFDSRILDVWEKMSVNLRFSDAAFKAYEKEFYDSGILKIGFTGSKEIKHFQKKSKATLLTKIKARFRCCFLPRSLHYLYVFFGLPEYYYRLFINRDININRFVVRKLLKTYMELTDR